jgi:hypothetical protein
LLQTLFQSIGERYIVNFQGYSSMNFSKVAQARLAICLLITSLSVAAVTAHAESEENLAKQLANPIASLISVPFQYNDDSDIGSAEGSKTTLNIQPVYPFEMNNDWNIISRTILPLVSQHNVTGNSGDQSGFGDLTESLFFSPKQPTAGGVIWGVGPVFLIPTATESMLGGKKWGLGPTGVALVQKGPWTYGVLANHIWSVAGDDNRADISSTFLQPFFGYITQTKTTFNLQSESTYNWKTSKWSTPVNAGVNQLFKVGNTPMSVGAQLRYWLQSPDSGPHGWGFRFMYTLLFPK